jgi:putative endonuclease
MLFRAGSEESHASTREILRSRRLVYGLRWTAASARREPLAQDDTVGGGMRTYYVYIMTNRSRTLYTGVTNNLERRVREHKQKLIPGFTRRYNITILVHYEETDNIGTAILREKQIKGWLRAKKITLIESTNPEWKDLSLDWYD